MHVKGRRGAHLADGRSGHPASHLQHAERAGHRAAGGAWPRDACGHGRLGIRQGESIV